MRRDLWECDLCGATQRDTPLSRAYLVLGCRGLDGGRTRWQRWLTAVSGVSFQTDDWVERDLCAACEKRLAEHLRFPIAGPAAVRSPSSFTA